MSETKRKYFSGELKAKIALEAIRGIKTVNEVGQEFGVHVLMQGTLLSTHRASLCHLRHERQTLVNH